MLPEPLIWSNEIDVDDTYKWVEIGCLTYQMDAWITYCPSFCATPL